MGMSLAREINQRFIEGPHRPEPRPDPSRAFAAVSRAVRLTLILEARTEKQILAWRKGDLSCPRRAGARAVPGAAVRLPVANGASACAIASSPCHRPRDPRPAMRRTAMRGRVQRELIETEDLDDHRLKGGFRACVEAICDDLGLEARLEPMVGRRRFRFRGGAASRPRSGERRGVGGLQAEGSREIPGASTPSPTRLLPLKRAGPALPASPGRGRGALECASANGGDRQEGRRAAAPSLEPPAAMPLDAFTNTFAGNPLDRVSEKRSDGRPGSPIGSPPRPRWPWPCGTAGLWSRTPRAAACRSPICRPTWRVNWRAARTGCCSLGLWKETAVFAVDLESDTDPADGVLEGLGRTSRTCA